MYRYYFDKLYQKSVIFFGNYLFTPKKADP